MPSFRAIEEAAFEYLRITGKDLAVVEGREPGGVDEGSQRLTNETDSVLESAVVEARLASVSGICHREQGGGDIEEVDTAFVGSGCKTAKVADEASADMDEQGFAGSMMVKEEGPNPFDGRKGLVGLGGFQNERREAMDTILTEPFFDSGSDIGVCEYQNLFVKWQNSTYLLTIFHFF